MTWKVNKRVYNFIIILICTFSTDIILKLIRGSNVFNWTVFRILLSSIIISYVMSYIFSKFKDKTAMILSLIFCFLVNFYAYLQIGFFKYIGTYMSFNTSSQAYKVVDYLYDFLVSITAEYYLLFIPVVLLLIYYFVLIPLLRKKKNIQLEIIKEQSKLNFFLRIVTKVLFMTFLCFLYYLTLVAPFMQSKYQFEKNIDVFLNPENQSVAIDQFGVNVFFFIDVNSVIFPKETKIEEVPYVPQEPFIPTDYSRYIDDSVWKTVIDNETNQRLKQINNYFISRHITDKNDNTGLFKDKNLIVIMMESVGMLGINEEYFPTLYKLWNEGISFTNFYSPRNSCPTGNNEMTSMVGLYTINNSCTANAYRKNIYPHAIFHKFRENGYYATSYHNYIDHYYYRNDIHRNSGSEIYYNAIALDIMDGSNKNWPSDVALFEKGLPYFIEQEKFMSFMTTVTSHAPYHIDSEYGNKNKALFEELNVTNAMKRYYSKVYELDLGLKYLLEELERTNKLDDTVLILFGDHQPYSLGIKQQVDILGEEAEINKNIEKTPLIIYNSQIEKQVVNEYVSVIDILPTILNLFDLEHDPRYYVGEDIFNDQVHHRAIFTDGSWQDEIGFFNASNDKFIPNDPENIEKNYTVEEIIEINTEINTKQKMSTNAIKNNYFYHLFEDRKKYSNN